MQVLKNLAVDKSKQKLRFETGVSNSAFANARTRLLSQTNPAVVLVYRMKNENI